MALTSYVVGIVLIIILVVVVSRAKKQKKQKKKPDDPTQKCRYAWTAWGPADPIATLRATALGAAGGMIPLLVRDQSAGPSSFEYALGYSTDMKMFYSYGGLEQEIKPGQTWYLTGAGVCPKTLTPGTKSEPHLMTPPGSIRGPRPVGYIFPDGGLFAPAGRAGYGYIRTGG
jgi:hypothetical protein